MDSLGYFQLEWPRGWEEIDISVKELVPVVVAATMWGGLWRGKHICFHSDNMAVVSILSTKTAKSPHLMHLLKCFSFYCAFYCINVSCVHVPGAMNAAADALSCNKLPLFSSLVPQALPFPIPASLVDLLVTSRLDWGSQAWTELFVRSLTALASYPLRNYAPQGLPRGACGRRPLTDLPIYRSSHNFDDAMLWAASMAATCTGIVFASERGAPLVDHPSASLDRHNFMFFVTVRLSS